MKTLIRMVNKLDDYLKGQGSHFWTVGLVILVVVTLVGLLLVGGLALWGLLSLMGLSVTYWGCTLGLLCVYVLLKLVSLIIR